MPVAVENNPVSIKSKFHFTTGIRFEIFMALLALRKDKESDIHAEWIRTAESKLPDEFYRLFTAIGGSHAWWPVIADAFETVEPDISFEGILEYLREKDTRELQTSILVGGLHDAEMVQRLIDGEQGVESIGQDTSENELKWFGFLDVHPYSADNRGIRTVENLIHQPEEFRSNLIALLECFWESLFKQTWDEIHPKLEASRGEKRRLFESLSVSEFARQVLVRVAFDEKKLILSSTCHFNADIADLHACHVIPSLFNDRRIWSIYRTEQGTVIYIPYLESAISFTAHEEEGSSKQAAISIDPGMIFKALGDNTRYGIVKEISKKPRTSAQLARRLSVSKPTISHHVQTLRESGLISEEYTSSGVELSIRKEVIEELSHTLVADLFGEENR